MIKLEFCTSVLLSVGSFVMQIVYLFSFHSYINKTLKSLLGRSSSSTILLPNREPSLAQRSSIVCAVHSHGQQLLIFDKDLKV
ncbi:hypothetical protein QVD17_03891 [Tagetes erecta]|uniref:Uncharacterized protein n=1 Tax=Tagetes erecta TaxID=13708 RepID=A0AAD8LBR5_TARER|nr:hypothetical protein QVD17_03891 [Tagetes erecta]